MADRMRRLPAATSVSAQKATAGFEHHRADRRVQADAVPDVDEVNPDLAVGKRRAGRLSVAVWSPASPLRRSQRCTAVDIGSTMSSFLHLAVRIGRKRHAVLVEGGILGQP